MLLICIIFSSVYDSGSCRSADTDLTKWDEGWSYRIELDLPIDTSKDCSNNQPIDLKVNFNRPCWGINESHHSVRVCCWYNNNWRELESQIYDLELTSNIRIRSCRVVFLTPDFVDGSERYFVFYDDSSKSPVDYKDHVSVKDEYYYYEPISEINAEANYYEIKQDGYVIYGVGQKGKAINRHLSQCIVGQKDLAKKFSGFDTHPIATFCFSYHHGTEEDDEISSDQKLVSKDILVDGNLMVKFGIESSSTDGSLKTTNIYRYYYCPTAKKRMQVHVKHEVLEEGEVTGITNVDGRYGAVISFESRSESLKKMRFGDILPYMHLYSETDDIREYELTTNPESSSREWIVSYIDDCDLGSESWFSYDEGEEGKAYGMIFPSNKNIVQSGTNVRDGIQLKVAEKEYFDAIGAEVDYAIINFGRNSYERENGEHERLIPDDLVVEYDAEYFYSKEGGYHEVRKEAAIYKKLISLNKEDSSGFQGSKKIHTLTVVPRFTARLFSHPFISNITGINIAEIWGEIYKDGKLIDVGHPTKPFIGAPRIKFNNLEAGNYNIKIFRKILNFDKKFIGFESVQINDDERIAVYCTWQKSLTVKTLDQNREGIEDTKWFLYKNNTVISKNTTKKDGFINLKYPFNLFNSVTLNGFYKGFKVYEKKIPLLQNSVNLDLELHDLNVEIKDRLDMKPGVELKPFLTSKNMNASKFTKIYPVYSNNQLFQFENLPSFTYQFHVSYASYRKTHDIDIPSDLEKIDIDFSALYKLSFNLYDKKGKDLENNKHYLDIVRDGGVVYSGINPKETMFLPPAIYTLKVYSNNGELIGIKLLNLKNSKTVDIVTTQGSIFTILAIGLALVFMGEMVVLVIMRKISINSFLKLIAMSLIFISLFLPWWSLSGETATGDVKKTTDLFIYPQTMIESLEYEGNIYSEKANIPEIFTNFLNFIFIVVCSGIILIGLSFIPNILLKKHYRRVLMASGILFLILITIGFIYGMDQICDITVGSLFGSRNLNVYLPDQTNTLVPASWGLGIGFYICFIAGLIAFVTGIIDSFEFDEWPKTLRRKILRF